MTLAATLKSYGLVTNDGFAFDTISIQLPGPTEARAALLRAKDAGYNLCEAGGGVVQVACDETTTLDHLRDVVAALVGASRVGSGLDAADVRLTEAGDDAIPEPFERTSKFLTHPVFSAHRSETAMLRYLRRLSDLDVALDRSMIPLGSCTMKLNAAAEMEADHLARVRRPAPVRPRGRRGGLRRAASPTSSAGCAPSPATTPAQWRRTPGRRASWPGCSPSGPTTPPGPAEDDAETAPSATSA